MAGEMPGAWAVVVPTVGRPGLAVLLASLAVQDPAPAQVVVVDDRPGEAPGPLDVAAFPSAVVVRPGERGGRGPAAARNAGWRAASTPWVVFVDDDVVLPPAWSRLLVRDLAEAGERTGAVAGRITVPLPAGRRPTDWERNTAGLATARWATADLAYRRAALAGVGGFDERFRRAYREDADLALRVQDAGWQLRRGRRRVVHPVRPADRWVSVRNQRGNADDALMRALHGRRWHERAQAPPGALPQHLLSVGALGTGLLAAAAGRPRAAGLAGLAWAGLTLDFARRRIAPGPRTADEVATMLATSAVVPAAAVWWRARGTWRWRDAARCEPRILHDHRSLPDRRLEAGVDQAGSVRAVLLDRDGTLVHDVPHNGDPELVRPLDGAAEALARLRAAGLRLGVVTNQSGIALGRFTAADERRVAARVERLLGPFDTWQVCPHTAADGCACRKPAPGMVVAAAAALGVDPRETVVIGDVAADVGAARAAGARAILVPTADTRPAEVADAPQVAASLAEAVDLVLGVGGR